MYACTYAEPMCLCASFHMRFPAARMSRTRLSHACVTHGKEKKKRNPLPVLIYGPSGNDVPDRSSIEQTAGADICEQDDVS